MRKKGNPGWYMPCMVIFTKRWEEKEAKEILADLYAVYGNVYKMLCGNDEKKKKWWEEKKRP